MTCVRWIALFLLLNFVSSFGYSKVTEDECSTKDYSSRFVPPKDQGNVGFCYSFAASDLVAEAAGVKPPDTVSAFQTAAQYVSMSPEEVQRANEAIVFENPVAIPMGGMVAGPSMSGSTINPNFRNHNPTGQPLLKREGGQTDLIAAHLISQSRACLEKDVPSELMEKGYKDPAQQKFFALQMGKLAGGEQVQKFVKTDIYKKMQTSCVSDPFLENLDQTRPLKEAIQDWAAEKLRQQTDKMCVNPVWTKGLKVHTRAFDGGSGAVKYMMSVLEKDRPFALHYNVSNLVQWPKNAQSWHASIVTGRRWNKSKQVCEVVIKNSWGENCENALDPKSCDKGTWYLDIETFAKEKSEVIWIDKSNR
ncbi:hypothetical protein [Bdellovibrio sp. HCB2-146]|uniref:hypothetical protein n=1 Tax=Bdellovibrio sp. HCB2-146 TaxID=3394362 RepID=UPI0039BD4232